MNGNSVLMRGIQRAVRGTPQEDSCVQTRKWVLIRHQVGLARIMNNKKKRSFFFC